MINLLAEPMSPANSGFESFHSLESKNGFSWTHFTFMRGGWNEFALVNDASVCVSAAQLRRAPASTIIVVSSFGGLAANQ